MNCDYLKDPIEPHTRKLQFLSSVYQLEQLISEPTRVTDKSATLIDLAFTNDTNNISKSGVIYNGMSDHSIPVCVLFFLLYMFKYFIYFSQESRPFCKAASYNC